MLPDSEFVFAVEAVPGVGDLKPVDAAVELNLEQPNGALAWTGAVAGKRTRRHPQTGLPLVLVFPGEEWRLTLRSLDGASELLACLYVCARGRARWPAARPHPPRARRRDARARRR